MKKNSSSVFFISLGCPRNLVDTEVMIGLLQKEGYTVASTLEKANYVVINTCGFLEEARTEAVETIREALQNVPKGAKVIVTGCMVGIHSERLKKECPGIHYLLGSGDTQSIVQALRSLEPGETLGENKSFLEMGEVPRTRSTLPNVAYLKIAEGCRKRCSYCIIPIIKGSLKSKSLEQVLFEFRHLLSEGVREIILIAQDLGDWGKDLGYHGSDGLAHLLEILSQEPGDFRIRLLYLYPDEISEKLIGVIKASTKIIHYLDMPIQHINDVILKRMNRHTSKGQILHIINTLRDHLPDVHIRTSLIVGFPGETEEQFQELVEFVKEARLDHVGIFEYSQEEMSASSTFPEQLSFECKKNRAETLAAIQKDISSAKNKQYIGKAIPVVIEKYHPESPLLLVGRHDGQCPDIDGCVIINDFRKVKAFGKRYLVEITDSFEYDLVGRVIGPEQSTKAKKQ